jgi:hypothetical protein
MNAQTLGQDQLVSVGTPAGRYWVSATSAPGGYGFEQLLISRPAIDSYYSDLEIALMAEYPELFNDPRIDEEQAFLTARQRAIQPLLEAGYKVTYEPEPEEAPTWTPADLALPVAAGAGLFAVTMAGLREMLNPLAKMREGLTAAIEEVTAKLPAPTIVSAEAPGIQAEATAAIQQDMEREAEARKSPLAWPVAAGVMAFSLLGLQ